MHVVLVMPVLEAAVVYTNLLLGCNRQLSPWRSVQPRRLLVDGGLNTDGRRSLYSLVSMCLNGGYSVTVDGKIFSVQVDGGP